MFVHWWNTVESQGVVMQLVQVGVSGLVHMRSGGGLNLNKQLQKKHVDIFNIHVEGSFA